MWFRLSVADRVSGVETKWDVEGHDEADAIKRAEAKGYLISACEQLAADAMHGGKVRANQKEPSVGAMVHFILPDGPQRGAHRPAVITHLWSKDHPIHPGLSDLCVFKAKNDDFIATGPAVMVTAVSFRESTVEKPDAPGTWHWPE